MRLGYRQSEEFDEFSLEKSLFAEESGGSRNEKKRGGEDTRGENRNSGNANSRESMAAVGENQPESVLQACSLDRDYL
ncbi:hypothetical protein WH47_06030 [Habropoda laboriosa]|uniref:Uncharacterized protein n=1 Tax=Habropoda laboriosa TaxID=597456 RepID=A0A0L7QRV5_9HYME|nr:hypothetical protein WH47_06030 [Habropoda laboriosa]